MRKKKNIHTFALLDLKPNQCLYYWNSIIYPLKTESVLEIQICLQIRHQTRMSSTVEQEQIQTSPKSKKHQNDDTHTIKQEMCLVYEARDVKGCRSRKTVRATAGLELE